MEILSDSGHPVRLWMSQRNLWLPSAIVPPALRWHDESEVQGRAGSIVVAAAPPESWLSAWPEIPVPTGVQMLRIGSDGSPAVDAGGLDKRSKGRLQDSVCVLGDPRPEVACGAIVVEGVADGLSVASRYPETVVVMFGTSGFGSSKVAEYLTRYAYVRIVADFDEAGQEAGQNLVGMIQRRGGLASTFVPLVALLAGAGDEVKDPAKVAANMPPLTPGTAIEREFAFDLHRKDGLPLWEACRLAWTTLRTVDDAASRTT